MFTLLDSTVLLLDGRMNTVNCKIKQWLHMKYINRYNDDQHHKLHRHSYTESLESDVLVLTDFQSRRLGPLGMTLTTTSV